MSNISGMDVAAVRQLSASLQTQAQSLQGAISAINTLLADLSGKWVGPDATAFVAWWSEQHRPALVAAQAAIDGLSQSARNNADDQERTSGGTGSTAAVGTATTPALNYNPAGLAGLATSFLAVMGGGGLKVLESADFFASIPGYLQASKVLEATGKLPVVNGLSRIPIAGSALAIGDVALNWYQHGIGDSRTQGAAFLGTLGVAANFTPAGPIGGLAFTAGTTIGTLITDHTQVDETLASGAFSLAYGDRQLEVPDKPASFWKTASQSEIDAYLQQSRDAQAEAQRIVERTEKPWLLVADMGQGLWNKIF